MDEVERLIVSAFPELQALLDAGEGPAWRLFPVSTEMVLGTRPWSDFWTDHLQACFDKPAQAGRIRPGGLVWYREGTLDHVVRELLALAPPEAPDAPREVIPNLTVPSSWAP
jgi:hypothetical protein